MFVRLRAFVCVCVCVCVARQTCLHVRVPEELGCFVLRVYVFYVRVCVCVARQKCLHIRVRAKD